MIECNVGILAGNLPTLKPLFRTALGSTYGRGSRRSTVATYVPSTKNRSGIRDYATLASNKSANAEFKGYGLAGEAYELKTVIDTNKTQGYEVNSSPGRSSPGPGKSSTESVTRLKGSGLSGLGDITVTTKVDVSESIHSRECYEEGRDRPQAKDLV